ncbi:MAG: lytic transglycosylase [Candidatus Pelagibacter sp. TMED196]|nr:MAG: lytic transglycosylase [Candidatus Pelagibacter sp. TMED196]
MLKHLISLVFLFVALTFVKAYSDTKTVILPSPKPQGIFKSIKKVESRNILPLKKPTIGKPKLTKIKETLPQNKPLVEKEIKVEKKVEIVKEKKIIPKNSNNEQVVTKFLLPEKKPITYKTIASKEAQESKVLSKKDYSYAKEVFFNINEKKWTSVFRITKKVKDKDFKNLISWIYLKEKSNKASFSDYIKFIDDNPNYPRINRLRYLAEHKINLSSNSPNTVIGWFESTPPLSGFGKIKLGESYFIKGDNVKAEKLIKEGWINASLSSKDLRYLNKKYKNFLNSSDHLKRADYMAWEYKYWDLKRILRYLPKDYRALYNARQILMSNSYGVDDAISKVPDNLKSDIGLRYDRLKWRSRRGRTDSSLEIIDRAPLNKEELVRADLWWKQRNIISRSLIYKKKYQKAYEVAKNHALDEGPEFAEAEWMAGWIAVSFLNNPNLAVGHFKSFYQNVGYPISLGRGAYWIGICYEKLGKNKLSQDYFKEGSKYLTTFYGQLSFKKIDPTGQFELVDNSKYTKEYEKEFNKNPLVKHVVLLKELNKTTYSKDIIKHLADLNIEKGSEVLAAKLATEVGRYDYAIQVSKKASYEKRFYNKYNYPIITTPRVINGKNMPSQEIILAITRQESEFDSKANSYVGAKGMMQLMTYTAKLVAKQMGVPYRKSKLTSDPEYNIRLGTYYFNSLLNEYGETYPFAIAAYNAGPKRVKYWRKINGDPKKGNIDFVNWIELIKFKETRNYVQRVLENASVYRYMLSGKPVELDNFFR